MNFRNLIASGSRIGNRLWGTVSAPASSATVESSVSALPAAAKATNGVKAPIFVSTVMSRQRDLYNKLSKLTVTGRTVEETLNQFIMVRKEDLFSCAKLLRKLRRYQHALEIFDWMEMRKMTLCVSDHAVRLDLIAKTKGLESAEEYFNDLDPSTKNHEATYGSLLNCYCVELQEEKAKAHIDKMDEFGFITNSLPFNNMMLMYMRLGQPEKVSFLVNTMNQREISLCGFTYSLWVQSCESLNDLNGLEKIVEEMGKDDEAKTTWNTYANLAAIYKKAGLYEKAESAMKLMEKKMNPKNRDSHHFLISLYAGISKASEVNRVWESLKKARPKVNNMSYLVMLRALSNLDDIDWFKQVFAEWETKCSAYDMRLANMAINEFLKRDMYQEAEKILEVANEKCCEGPFAKARELLMIWYLENGEPELAMKHLESASDDDCSSWSSDLVRLIMVEFEKAKDVKGAEEFVSNWLSVDSEIMSFLLKVYVAAEKTCPDMRERLLRHQIEASEEIQDLLDRVCP